MPLVVGVHYLNLIPSLHLLTRVLSLSTVTTVAEKDSSRNQALSKSGKALGTRLTFTKKKKKSQPTDSTYYKPRVE